MRNKGLNFVSTENYVKISSAKYHTFWKFLKVPWKMKEFRQKVGVNDENQFHKNAYFIVLNEKSTESAKFSILSNSQEV